MHFLVHTNSIISKWCEIHCECFKWTPRRAPSGWYSAMNWALMSHFLWKFIKINEFSCDYHERSFGDTFRRIGFAPFSVHFFPTMFQSYFHIQFLSILPITIQNYGWLLNVWINDDALKSSPLFRTSGYFTKLFFVASFVPILIDIDKFY